MIPKGFFKPAHMDEIKDGYRFVLDYNGTEVSGIIRTGMSPSGFSFEGSAIKCFYLCHNNIGVLDGTKPEDRNIHGYSRSWMILENSNVFGPNNNINWEGYLVGCSISGFKICGDRLPWTCSDESPVVVNDAIKLVGRKRILTLNKV